MNELKHKSYYWIKLSERGFWEVGQYLKYDDDDPGEWMTCGSEIGFDYVKIVGPEIESPKP